MNKIGIYTVQGFIIIDRFMKTYVELMLRFGKLTTKPLRLRLRVRLWSRIDEASKGKNADED